MKRTPMQEAIRLNMPTEPGIDTSSLVAGILWLLVYAVIAGIVIVGFAGLLIALM